jgi:hypothetical protein
LTEKKGKASSAKIARALRRDKATGMQGQTSDQPLLRRLLDPKSSSLSLTALARSAASSGKRLVLEIRDDNPVRIIRTSAKGYRPEFVPNRLLP